MHELRELFRHNTWANANVFDLVARQDPEIITLPAGGTRDTVLGTLSHLAGVETVYLAMLEGQPMESLEPRDTYMTHTIDWFAGQVRELGARFDRVVESSTDANLERTLQIPWFDFSITASQGLLQVLTHSAQHRSQVLAWLSARGIETPDLDYVLMLRDELGRGASQR